MRHWFAAYEKLPRLRRPQNYCCCSQTTADCSHILARTRNGARAPATRIRVLVPLVAVVVVVVMFMNLTWTFTRKYSRADLERHVALDLENSLIHHRVPPSLAEVDMVMEQAPVTLGASCLSESLDGLNHAQ